MSIDLQVDCKEKTACLSQMLQAKAVRPRVRRAVTNITHGFYEDWLAELAAVKKAFEGARLSKPNSFYFPSTVASAHQILSFHRRLTSLLEEHAVRANLSSPCDGSPTRTAFHMFERGSRAHVDIFDPSCLYSCFNCYFSLP